MACVEKRVEVNLVGAWIGPTRVVAAAGMSTVVCLGVVAATTAPGAVNAVECALPRADDAYAAATRRVLRARRDLWGDQLLRAPAGPTYDAARRLLAPLLLAQDEGRPLTASGFQLPRARTVVA